MRLAFRLPLNRDLDQQVGHGISVSTNQFDFLIGHTFCFACEQLAAEVERNRVMLRLRHLRLFHDEAHNIRVVTDEPRRRVVSCRRPDVECTLMRLVLGRPALLIRVTVFHPLIPDALPKEDVQNLALHCYEAASVAVSSYSAYACSTRSRTRSCDAASAMGRSSAKLRRSPFTEY
jgi:hypothetical protein